MSEFWRVTIALSTALLVTGLLGWYVVARASWAFVLSRRSRGLLAAALGIGLLAAVLARVLGIAQAPLAELLGELGGVAMLAIVIGAVLLLPVELGLLARKLLRWQRARTGEPRSATESVALPSPERREFIAQAAAGGALSLGLGAAVYGTWVGRHDYTVETVPVKLDKLPRALDGLTIVQLSDLHVGTYVNERELSAALALVKQAKADVIVLTGDLLDHDIRYAPMLARFARQLSPLSRFGVHAIPGNHDHYAGASTMMQALREAGTDVLLNRHVRIGQGKDAIALAGIDDVAGPRFDSAGPRLDLAFAGVDDQTARVLLSHNPVYWPKSFREADLTLSGHTHGGQITMFINPAKLVLRHGLVRGLYHHAGSQLYVNRGFGTAGPPARIGSAPEITRLVLHV
jgi:predicted MPP superfamily phosphohydrolase